MVIEVTCCIVECARLWGDGEASSDLASLVCSVRDVNCEAATFRIRTNAVEMH
jgi:hypothetical protein